MKRFIALMLIVLFVFVAVSCGADTKKDQPAKETKEATKEAMKDETKEATKEESKEESKVEAIKEETKSEEKKEEVNNNTSSGNPKEIKLGQKIVVGDFEVTLHSLHKVKTVKGEPAVKVVYSWKNNSDSTITANNALAFDGFQDGAKTESIPFSYDIDYGTGFNDVEPGSGQENCETGVSMVNDSLLKITIDKFLGMADDDPYTLTVDPKTL